ncbi:MAG: sigma-70 family RNA polymerase sigma factor [Oscillospiraceae bacterium]|nr:sigma-70 family RNA polymerase sigma factor [Oscillospiraceae bacterium]MBR6600024.1 sigma-70 family RNA polymerase sigma factor [Oscillospiraceae bacterium]
MNSKEEFSRLVLKYKDSLFFTAKSILRNDTDAEDAVCNAIMKAFENLEQLKEENYFKSWITRIVINESYMICRKNKHTQSIEDVLYEPSYTDYHDETWEIVNSLEEEYRTVLILFYYNDIPIKDIADHLNIAVGTVKSRLNRGRQKVKALIG